MLVLSRAHSHSLCSCGIAKNHMSESMEPHPLLWHRLHFLTSPLLPPSGGCSVAVPVSVSSATALVSSLHHHLASQPRVSILRRTQMCSFSCSLLLLLDFDCISHICPSRLCSMNVAECCHLCITRHCHHCCSTHKKFLMCHLPT